MARLMRVANNFKKYIFYTCNFSDEIKAKNFIAVFWFTFFGNVLKNVHYITISTFLLSYSVLSKMRGYGRKLPSTSHEVR